MTNEEKDIKSLEPQKPANKMVQELLERLASAEETIKMLSALSSQQRMKDYALKASQNPETKTAYLKIIGGKVVVSWVMTKNIVYINKNTGALVEDQEVEVEFQDGTKQKMDLVEFSNNNDRYTCEILAIDHLKGHSVLLTPEGKELQISTTYLNP